MLGSAEEPLGVNHPVVTEQDSEPGGEAAWLRERCEVAVELQPAFAERGPQALCAMLIGYARVSATKQDTAVQTAALKAADRERIFREKASGGRWDRPELQKLLDQLRDGDVLVVWKLDRLSRSLRDVLTIMERLGEARAGFRCLTEAIDTTSAARLMMMQMVGAFAEFKRAMLRERPALDLLPSTRKAALQDAAKLSGKHQTDIVRMVQKGDNTAADAARTVQHSAGNRLPRLGQIRTLSLR